MNSATKTIRLLMPDDVVLYGGVSYTVTIVQHTRDTTTVHYSNGTVDVYDFVDREKRVRIASPAGSRRGGVTCKGQEPPRTLYMVG